jgi:hypothetical protein
MSKHSLSFALTHGLYEEQVNVLVKGDRVDILLLVLSVHLSQNVVPPLYLHSQVESGNQTFAK